MSLLGLLWRGGDTGTDSPDWLVGDDDLAPVLNFFANGSELASVDFVSAAGFALVKFLSNASHDLEAVVQGHPDLLGDLDVSLAEDVSALTVAENGPVDAKVFDHGCGGLASVCTSLVQGSVLDRQLNLGASELLLHLSQVKGAWSNHDLNSAGVESEWLQDLAWESFCEVNATVALPVASYKISSHLSVYVLLCQITIKLTAATA